MKKPNQDLTHFVKAFFIGNITLGEGNNCWLRQYFNFNSDYAEAEIRFNTNFIQIFLKILKEDLL